MGMGPREREARWATSGGMVAGVPTMMGTRQRASVRGVGDGSEVKECGVEGGLRVVTRALHGGGPNPPSPFARDRGGARIAVGRYRFS